MPSVYDRPQFELQRMEVLAMTLLQAGETLVAPATFTADVTPLLPPMKLTLSDQFQDGQRLVQRVYQETDYSPGQRSLHTSSMVHDGVLQAMQDGTLETADGQLVRLPDLLTWEQLNTPVLTVEAGTASLDNRFASLYLEQWSRASDLPQPGLMEAIDAIPGYDGSLPTLKQLLDGQQVLLDRAQQSPLATNLRPSLQAFRDECRREGQAERLLLHTTTPKSMSMRGGAELEFSNPYTVVYSAPDDSVSVFRPGRDAAVITVAANNTYFVDGLNPTDAAFLQQALPAYVQAVVETQVVSEPEPQIGFYSTVLESYTASYGEQSATVATVVALAQRGELFDTGTSDNAIVESYFHRVPNSTLIVNRVDTNDDYGLSKTFTVLDGDVSLFELGNSGQIELNNLTPGQVETLQTAQRDGANPLLVNESYFQVDIAQALTNDGEAQARAILSQGDAITPAMVAELNVLMAAEEDKRREDQAERGFSGEVRYPRFTEQELNRYLSTDTIARQLIAQSPVVEAQVVAAAEPPVMQSVADYMETVTPERIGSMVYAQYERWHQRYYNDPVEREVGYVRAGFLVESPGEGLGRQEPMPFQVIDIASDSVVMSFTLTEGQWVEQTPGAVVPDEQEGPERTPDVAVVSVLDESVRTRLLLGFEDSHKKAGLIASTYLNETTQDIVSLESGLILKREYEEDGSLWRDLTFSPDAVSSAGDMYAIAQVFPDGSGVGLSIPLTVEMAISQEFEYLVDSYEESQPQAIAQPLQPVKQNTLASDQQPAAAITNGQRETVSPQAPSPVAPKPQTPTLKSKEPKEATMTDIGTKTSVYARPEAEFKAMEARATELLAQGETLVVPGRNGVTELSLTSREPMHGSPTALMVERTNGAVAQEYEILLPKALRESCVLEAMHDGTLTKLDGQSVGLPDFAALAPVELNPIKLDDMLSEFGKDAMRGITGTRNTYNPATQSRGSEERTPGETFAKFAKGAYGIENFCKDNQIPFQGSADYLVNKTALELDLSPEFKAEILSGIKREECVAPVILATGTEVAAWKRVYELAPETFEAVATPAVQQTIAQDASVIAQAKSKTLEMMGITVKTVEPTRDPAKLGYEPAPATPETATLMAFRDSLTSSQLREWATAVQVNEPQNTDKQKWVADFTAKFQKSGYEMSDGGMSVGMAKRLTEVQQQMTPDVAQLRTEMAATINQMLSQAPNVEGKDYKKLEATKLGLTIKGNEGNFEVKGATGKLLMLAKDGEVTINRLPATVVSRMEGMVAMQQQMQQTAVQQRTVAPVTKKAAAVER